MAKLRYTRTGNMQQPTVLFLHGFMGSAADWQPVITGLSAHFHCVAVDLPGHGASRGLSTPEAYTFPGASRILEHLLDDLQVPHCTLVGYSMGGRLALYFATEHPDRCSRLVMESASPGLETASEQAARRRLDATLAERLLREDFEAFLNDWYRQPVFASLAHHPGLLERLVARRHDNDPSELAQVLQGMGTGQQPSLWERLGALEVSTLVVTGALDGKYAEIAERMAVHSDAVHTAVIARAGHNVHLEAPDVFLDVLRDFLSHPI